MMRFCPNCETERPVAELLCEGEANGHPCGWDLSGLPIRPEGWRPEAAKPPAQDVPAPTCPNGHPVDPGDLMCPECGADLDVGVDVPSASELAGSAEDSQADDVAGHPSAPDGWRIMRRLPPAGHVRESFVAERAGDGRSGILSIYTAGSDPDPEIYLALGTVSTGHVPEVLETGRVGERSYEITEFISGGTLADVGVAAGDIAHLRQVLSEVGTALAALGECGLRHRDLRPDAILVRSRQPLDLVIADFGSARLSDYDLDVVSPLETTRYTAPEALAGGVAAASDWWSLGIILLELMTGGDCFAGADDQTFLISVITNGAPIPEGLPPDVDTLLRGLLSLDRRARWSWPEARRWIAGDIPDAPSARRETENAEGRRSITLGGSRHSSPQTFALAAAEAQRWDEAKDLLERGDLSTWLEEAGHDPVLRRAVRAAATLEEASPDLRLSLALKAMNPLMPLVVRGEIVTPGWLLEHPDEGYALVTGPIPERLEREGSEGWLGRLQRREARVRERARQLDVEIDEAELRVAALSTSRSRLAAVWDEKRRILPDTDHAGLAALTERRVTEEEDLILLLSAAVGQFRSADAIVDEAATTAGRAGVTTYDRDAALAVIARPRREIHSEIERRLEGFSRCGLDRVDEWADQFRLERRLPLARALSLLAVPEDAWRQPPRQTYVATLLDFFAKRITGAIMRGPLTRMVIGKASARIDLPEINGERRSAASILDHILLRNDQAIDIDPAVFAANPQVERRIRTLHSHATLYRRDTGIDGLYMGFPFLVMQETRATTRPRIAPIMLWPVKINPEVGARGRISVSFDRDREEVRLNPALEALLGAEEARRWQEVCDDVLRRATVTAAEAVEAFAGFVAVGSDSLRPLPGSDLRLKPGEDRVEASAALFHLGFMGQAVMEDLRQLKSRPPEGTSLETALRMTETAPAEDGPSERVPERSRFFTSESDPSQEAAVLEARAGKGLLVEGPPGTGKSQTIVNMVADAIGTGRTLLVVCQKQAAIEVVHKRLEAAGLGGRVVMVNDVNKDREPVLRAVREQLEEIFQRPRGPAGWQQQREQAAARVEALERNLDEHHGALHALDEPTGLSYRLILGDLIELASEGATPSLPALRQNLAALDVGGLTMLQEELAPTARLWLAARFEGSPLASTRPFAADPGTVEVFSAALREFAEVEGERAAVIERTPGALAISEPEPYRSFAASHGAALRQLGEDQRSLLARWLDLLAGVRERGPGKTSVQVELASLRHALAELPPDDAPDDAVALARSQSDADLKMWKAISDRLLAPPTFFQRLSPGRWMSASRRRSLLKSAGLSDPRAFGDALHRESRLRPLRARIMAAQQQIGEADGQLPLRRVPELADAVSSAIARLSASEAIVARLEDYPSRDAAFAVARKADAAAVDDLLLAIGRGLMRHASREKSREALSALGPWMADEWLGASASAISGDQSNAGRIDPVVGVIAHTASYQRFRARASQLEPLTMTVFSRLATIRETLEALPAEQLEPVVRRIIGTEGRLAWKGRIEQAHPALLLDAGELEGKAQLLATADRELRAFNKRLLVEGIDVSKLRPLRDWEDITRLRGARARRMREFVERGADLGLMALRPVWLVNPDVASRLLPLRKAFFDTIIFDEASQMPIEYALSALFRARTMIISGDEKQMPPTAFFSSRVENDEAGIFEGATAEEDLDDEEREAAQETWNRREIKDCPDLLQLGKIVLPSRTLEIHYRSAFRELIQFSNASFYAGRLNVPARHPAEEIRRIRPIELIRVDGVYGDQTNPAEAERVVDVVRDIWLSAAGAPPTVGVVSFNRKQADLIEEALEARAEADPAFRTALSRERDRVEGGEDMCFFVKNVENVQGDERDVIVFSSTFGKNAQGTFRRSFGVLGQVGGQRRLNVAVTRARKKVILVTSMPIASISDFLATRRQASSARDFLQAYFEYAALVSSGDLESAQSLLSRLSPERSRQEGYAGGQDGLEAAVTEELRALGWEPTNVREDGAFGIDLAVEDPRTGLFGIGIECDAPRHPLLERARAREVWRPQVLRRSVPVLHRVSSHRWFHEPEVERARLRDAVAQALGERN
ncbi:MAG: histidine kinase [Methylobacterium sp.]|nr:histidine kinase [Methylobacterium sp.]